MRPMIDPTKMSAQLAELPADIANGMRRVFELMGGADNAIRSGLGQAVEMHQLEEARTILMNLLPKARAAGLDGRRGLDHVWTMTQGIASITALMRRAQIKRGARS